jgi:hypothetical protein
MKKIKLIVLLLPILIGVHLDAQAGEYSYQCVVINDAFIEEDGKIRIFSESLNIGKKFAVNKKTGDLTGDIYFAAYPFTTPKIIAKGGKDGSFKVLWVAKAGGKDSSHSDLLVVKEYAIQLKKSFSYFTGSQLTTGLCD